MAIESKDIELTANERPGELDQDDIAAQEAVEDARKAAHEQSGGALEVCVPIVVAPWR